MNLAEGEVPYVLGQQRMTLAELRAELEGRNVDGQPPVSPRWLSPAVVIGSGVVVALAALLTLWAAIVATSV